MKEQQFPVSIEPLADTDVAQLVALAREIWHAHYSSIISAAQIKYMLEQRYSPDVVRAELRQSGLWWDKLMLGAEMAGFASYFLVDDDADRMKLDKLYVHPRHQRRGYGGMMIARACAAARAHACRGIELAVNKNNRGAIDAYLKHGFRVAASVVKDIGGGFVMDDYIMVKPVTGDGSASRGGAGSPESGSGAAVVFRGSDLAGDHGRRSTASDSGRIPNNLVGAPAPPRQPPRLRDAVPGGAQSGRQDVGDIHGNTAEAADE